MPEQKKSHFLRPLFITTGVLACTVIITSYVLLKPSQQLSETAIKNTDVSKDRVASEQDKHLNPDIGPEFINGIAKNQLLALLPKSSPDDDLAPQDRQPLTLWQPVDQDNTATDPGQLKVAEVISNPAQLEALESGRKIDFVIPQTDEQVAGKITAQRRTDKGVQVFDIELDNGNALTGGHIVRGQKSTDIAVVTEQGNYTVSINNKTGAGEVIDDKDLNIYRTETDVVVVPTDTPPKPEPEPTS